LIEIGFHEIHGVMVDWFELMNFEFKDLFF